MNTVVTDPHWGWWIVWYFYLGGIGAGAYFIAALIEIFGDEQDRKLGRVGYLLAAPLVAVCGVLLILDLEQPTRFWHMLFDAETFRPHVKYWSPMSIGAWALLMFGAISTISFLGASAEIGVFGLGRWAGAATRLHRGVFGRAFDVIGSGCGFFIASYTGALLTATNQPIWSDSPWIAAMFLASSATTGLAVMRLVAGFDRGASEQSLAKLDRVDGWALGLEFGTILLFFASLGDGAASLVRRSPLLWLLFGTLGMGVCLPLVLRVVSRRGGQWAHRLATALVLAGGFVMRWSVLAAAPAMLERVGRDAP